MLAYLDLHLDGEEEWKQDVWEDLVLKLLSRTIDTIADEGWILQVGGCHARLTWSGMSRVVCDCQVGQALGDQYDLYPDNAAAKSMLSKGLGIVLRKATKKGPLRGEWMLGLRSCCWQALFSSS